MEGQAKQKEKVSPGHCSSQGAQVLQYPEDTEDSCTPDVSYTKKCLLTVGKIYIGVKMNHNLTHEHNVYVLTALAVQLCGKLLLRLLSWPFLSMYMKI